MLGFKTPQLIENKQYNPFQTVLLLHALQNGFGTDRRLVLRKDYCGKTHMVGKPIKSSQLIIL